MYCWCSCMRAEEKRSTYIRERIETSRWLLHGAGKFMRQLIARRKTAGEHVSKCLLATAAITVYLDRSAASLALKGTKRGYEGPSTYASLSEEGKMELLRLEWAYEWYWSLAHRQIICHVMLSRTEKGSAGPKAGILHDTASDWNLLNK